MPLEHAPPLRLPDGRGIALRLDAWGRLHLKGPDGRDHANVEPVRAFPISDPDHWISFCDEHGREVLSLRTTDGLAAEDRGLLNQELSLREFVPVIKRIVRIHGEGTPSDWEIETDRGATRFTLDSEEDVRRLGPSRVLITDAKKLRYQVPDLRKLDGTSRRALEHFL